VHPAVARTDPAIREFFKKFLLVFFMGLKLRPETNMNFLHSKFTKKRMIKNSCEFLNVFKFFENLGIKKL
jgi:hypothetical protein